MSSIPSDIASSAAQAGYQAREVGAGKDAVCAAGAEAAQRQVREADDSAAMVDTTDRDTAVFADAEGAGGQGRQSETETPQEEPPSQDEAPKGITCGPDGKLHIDLEA